MQLNHYNSNFQKKQFPIVLVCQNVTNAPNIGSLFRTADAFGVQKIIFCGGDIPLGRKMTKTSRATEKFVVHEVAKDVTEVISNLKAKDYQIISLEITDDSQMLNEVQFLTNKSIALVIGDENFGVSENVLKQSDKTIHINMYGQNSSMNVVQATTIALYEITKQIG